MNARIKLAAFLLCAIFALVSIMTLMGIAGPFLAAQYQNNTTGLLLVFCLGAFPIAMTVTAVVKGVKL